MLDWYLIATPLFGILVILVLVTLKVSLRNDIQVPQSWMKKIRTQETQRLQKQEKTAFQKYQTLKVLKYLVQNFTFLQFCLTRKSKNKLPLLLSISANSALCIINPSLFINGIIGIPITLVFFIAQTCFEKNQANPSILDGQAEDFSYIRRQVKQQNKTISKNKYLYISYAVLTSAISLYICGLTFKNYSNLFLSTFLKNLVVSNCIDIFLLRFIMSFIVCFPFSFVKSIQTLIENQRIREIYFQKLIDQNGLKDCATNLSPRKKQNLSPSKIPKAVPKLGRENSQNQALKNAIQICKKVKIYNNQQLSKHNKNQVHNYNNVKIQEQYSVNHLLQDLQTKQKQKGRETPVALFKDDDQRQASGFKTKRKDTDLVIVEFKRNQEETQGNQEEKEEEESVIQRKAASFLHSNLDFDDEFNKRQQSQSGQNINGENRLNIIKLLNDAYQKQRQFIDQEANRHNLRHNQPFLTLNVDRHNPLHINQNQQQQIQEIDPNSPDRRRKRGLQGYQQSSQYKLKKKAKHFNGNAKRRVIKFTSGEPYLEYLPNMLSKDALKHKKSQPITHAKPEFQTLDDRRKSVKKCKTKKQPKFMFGGDENQHPGRVQALQVQDL